jgi:hypothetical protein
MLKAYHSASCCAATCDASGRSLLEESAEGMARAAATWDAAKMSMLEMSANGITADSGAFLKSQRHKNINYDMLKYIFCVLS